MIYIYFILPARMLRFITLVYSFTILLRQSPAQIFRSIKSFLNLDPLAYRPRYLRRGRITSNFYSSSDLAIADRISIILYYSLSIYSLGFIQQLRKDFQTCPIRYRYYQYFNHQYLNRQYLNRQYLNRQYLTRQSLY